MLYACHRDKVSTCTKFWSRPPQGSTTVVLRTRTSLVGQSGPLDAPHDTCGGGIINVHGDDHVFCAHKINAMFPRLWQFDQRDLYSSTLANLNTDRSVWSVCMLSCVKRRRECCFRGIHWNMRYLLFSRHYTKSDWQVMLVSRSP